MIRMRFLTSRATTPPLYLSPPPALDLTAVKSLLVETFKIATKVAELDTDSESDPKIRFLASAWTSLFVLVEAVIEKTLDPLVTGQGGAALKASRPPPPPLQLMPAGR